MLITAARRIVLAAVVFVLAASAAAQEGHPLAGTWYGEYQTGAQKHDMTLVMTWDGKVTTGTLNPGPGAAAITSAALDITPGKPAPEGRDSTEGIPPTFKVRIEVSGMVFEGTIHNPVAGNRRIIGTWSRGSERGTFTLRRL
jgi:hypothetical protein